MEAYPLDFEIAPPPRAQNPARRRWVQLAFAVSLVLHATLGYFAILADRAAQLHNASLAPIQVETVGEKDYLQALKDRYKKPQDRQLVQMDDRNKAVIKPDTKQKIYSSKFDQIADVNTRAAQVGKFKNVDREGVQSSATKVKKLFELPQDLLKAEDDSKVVKTEAKPSGELHAPEMGRSPASLGAEGDGYSANDDYLKDVVVGAQTLLNTEEYKFYSFYARIREALSAQWSYRVRQELTQIYASGDRLGGLEKITKVEVRLNRRGELVHTKVLSSSGYGELDRAAAEAFRAAAPFPYPPTDMIDEHDEVAIKWDFVVYASEQSGIRVKINRGGM